MTNHSVRVGTGLYFPTSPAPLKLTNPHHFAMSLSLRQSLSRIPQMGVRRHPRPLYTLSLSTSSRRASPPILPGEQPPTVQPTSHPTATITPSTTSMLTPDQGSVAGPRPPPPALENVARKAPRIRASKAAITLVSGFIVYNLYSLPHRFVSYRLREPSNASEHYSPDRHRS